MGELADLLTSTREEHDDMVVRREAACNEEMRKEEEKKDSRRRIVTATRSRRRSVRETVDLLDDVDDIVETRNGEGSIRKKLRIVEQEAEMNWFGQHIKEAETASVELEKD